MERTSSAGQSFVNDSHLPFWDQGSGHYGNTLGQQGSQIGSSSTDLILTLLDLLPVNKEGVFTFADYGTNDGYSSMPLVSSVIRRLRENHGEEFPIQIIYEDQEKNDFNSLFKRLSDESSYLSQYRKVFTFATHFNFYKQCVPDGACDVIFSNMAVQFLEKLPLRLKNCVFEIFASEEDRERFHDQGEQDWTKFLTLRAKELKPGGLLVLQTLCSRSKRDASQAKSDADASDKKNEPIMDQIDIYTHLEHVWKQLRDEKTITQEEYDNATNGMIFRTAEEMKRPFETDRTAVAQSGLRLLQFEQFVVPCVFKARWLQDQSTATAAAQADATFAHSLVAAHRVWSQSSFRCSLSRMRSEAEKTAIMEDLYERFQQLVLRQNPLSYRSDILIARLVIRKV
ncbi:uncharacterized protein LOC143291452 [Babylonia areolata]|uniref:uncharacterized protein LOC143291452 n=1 Tax=Babylonia areolata TaxID=304850 RepID=UPI003FD1376C